MSCIPYYPMQFFRSPRDQCKELLHKMFEGFSEPKIDYEEEFIEPF
jgi:hypothetical protein